MDIPQTMLVSKAYDYDKFVLEEMETPRPGPREALVKVHALGVCTGDVTPWYVHKKCPTVTILCVPSGVRPSSYPAAQLSAVWCRRIISIKTPGCCPTP